MKFSKSAVHRKIHTLPELRFEEQQLTSFSGLVVVQQLVAHLDLKERLRDCFRHMTGTPLRPRECCAVAHRAHAAGLSGTSSYPLLQR